MPDSQPTEGPDRELNGQSSVDSTEDLSPDPSDEQPAAEVDAAAPEDEPTDESTEPEETGSTATYQLGPRPGFERSRDESRRDRLRDIFGLSSLGLIIGAFLLHLGFITSYVGAFHEQKPHALTVSVISDHNWQEYVSNQLNAIKGQPVYAYAETDQATARTMLTEQRRQGVYLFNPNGETDTLLVASSAGSSDAAALELIFNQVAAKQGRQLQVTDVAPVQDGDSRGLTGFYLVTGWLVGGYLMASLVGMRRGGKAKNFRRMLWRLALCAGYAILSGLLGALIVDQWLGALTGHYWQVAGIGILLSLTASVFTMGMEAVFGTIGIGISILLFVVLGNPSAGGAYNYELLPQPWRFMGQWLPNGAGVDSIRSVVYLDGYNLGFHVGAMLWWLAVGLLIFLLAANNTYWGVKRPVEELSH